jgi:hypothetical protein
MYEGLALRPDSLVTGSARMREHGEEYLSALRRLNEARARLGSWGDESLIAPFVAKVDECFGLLTDVHSAQGDTLVGTGGALEATQATVRNADANGIERRATEGGASWV